MKARWRGELEFHDPDFPPVTDAGCFHGLRRREPSPKPLGSLASAQPLLAQFRLDALLSLTDEIEPVFHVICGHL
jgi:hypothetical protein